MFETFKSLFFGHTAPSHYEEKAQGPTIEANFLTTNQRIVLACNDLNAHGREYIPAIELADDQKKLLEVYELERELNRNVYDLGIWTPNIRHTTFTIREINGK